jgi:hypothetical protein
MRKCFKTQTELIAMLPARDLKIENPACWLTHIDRTGKQLERRYVFYNNSAAARIGQTIYPMAVFVFLMPCAILFNS